MSGTTTRIRAIVERYGLDFVVVPERAASAGAFAGLSGRPVRLGANRRFSLAWTSANPSVRLVAVTSSPVHLRGGLGLWGAVALRDWLRGVRDACMGAGSERPHHRHRRSARDGHALRHAGDAPTVRGRARYPNAFAAYPLCCPSRATILTGRYAHSTRVRNNRQAQRLDPELGVSPPPPGGRLPDGTRGEFLNSWPATTPPPHFDRYAMIFRRALTPTRGST